jgi:hypothetical protein
MPTATRRGARKPRAPRTATKERENPTSLEAAEVEIDIEDLGNFDESVNWLIYGPPGQGKTVLAGGTPNATFLSTEKGVVAAKRAGSKARLMRAPDWEHTLAGLKKADETLGPKDWLIVDSLTKMQQLYLRWILKTIHEENEARDLDIPAIQDHQKWQNGFKRFTDHMVDAPYNTIFICSAMIREDEEGDTLVLPDLQGKDYAISNYVSSQMDIITYYAVAPRKRDDDPMIRRLLFQPYPPYLAKDRYNAFGRFQDIEEGEYDAMVDLAGMLEEEAA